jgi:hypothetical protein
VQEGEKAGKLSLKYESALGEILFDVEAQDICLRCEEAVTNLLRRVLLVKGPPEKPRKKRAKKPAPDETLAPELPEVNGEAHEAWKEEQG